MWYSKSKTNSSSVNNKSLIVQKNISGLIFFVTCLVGLLQKNNFSACCSFLSLADYVDNVDLSIVDIQDVSVYHGTL